MTTPPLPPKHRQADEFKLDPSVHAFTDQTFCLLCAACHKRARKVLRFLRPNPLASREASIRMCRIQRNQR